MTDHNFEPDYEHWWDREDLTESDLAWLMLEVDPDNARKSIELHDKECLTPEEAEWERHFRYHLQNLVNGYRLDESHAKTLKRQLWGNGRDDFIINAYNRTMRFPDAFKSYLESIGAMPDHFEHYKNHARFKANLQNWKREEINTEDKALALLLGCDPDSLQRFFALSEKLKEKDAWERFSGDDRHFHQAYCIFITTEFSLDAISWGIIPGFCKKVEAMGLWNGDFPAYVQAVHDNGFVFKSNTYDALECYGIEPVYTRDGWARSFYRTWIEKGVWRLMDAAFLYIGDDPYKGRSFEGFGDPEKRASGRILKKWDEKTIIYYQVDENGKWITSPVCRFEEETSLEHFVKNHIDAETLTPASKDGSLKFKPKDIVTFFRDYFPLTYQPKALLIELDLIVPDTVITIKELDYSLGRITYVAAKYDERTGDPILPYQTENRPDKTHTGFAGRPAKSRDFMEQEFERRKKCGMVAETLADEARALITWLKQNHPEMPVPREGTVQNNLRPLYNQYKNEKLAA